METGKTEYVTVPCGGHDHVVQHTTLVFNEGELGNLRWILDAAARGQDFALNGDMRSFAGSMFSEIGFGDDPSLWPEGRPE